MNLRYFLPITFIAIIYNGCANDYVKPSSKTYAPDLALTKNISINYLEEDTLEASIGLWMFKKKALKENAIANWLNWYNPDILEPINIIWIDLRANDELEASKNIEQFLISNGWNVRSGSSTRYFAYVDGKWLFRYSGTWSDHPNPNLPNNHARVFTGHRLSSQKQVVHLSTGAFSREDGPVHHYISFNEARNALRPLGGWKLAEEELDLGNRIWHSQCTTMDHTGARVFVLHPQK